MTVTTLRAAYATWVQQDYPSSNWFRKTGYMSLDGTSGRANMGIVWFAAPFPSGSHNVVRATLTLRTRAISGTGASQITAQLCDKWSSHFGTVNWNSRPAGKLAQAQLQKGNPLPANTAWVFDVTDQMQAVANGSPFYGFVLTTQSGHQILVQGNMSAALDPSLSVQWQDNPLPPTELSPSTGHAVGTGSPWLTWQYRDYEGGDWLVSSQVRMAATAAGLPSPLWDSGEVETPYSEMNLAGQSSWTAPPPDAVRWWQVRCRDSSGMWSGWSDPVSWQWHALPTVALTQPDPTVGTFSDPTPPIQWSYSGDSPQTRWAVSVDKLVGSSWQRIARSGMVVGEDTSWTPDVGLAGAGTVRINVEVWDSRQREAVAGGLGTSASVSKQFTFKPSSTLTPVSGLTVSFPDRVLPTAILRFMRAEVPDFIEVWRDGNFLTRHPGLDFSTGGQTYQVRDAVCPNGPHRWTVYAVVNGKSRPAYVEATVNHSPTWIVDEGTGERVCIVGDTEHDLAMPETVTEFSPIGGNRKIRITSAQYGYEGTLTGQLVQQSGMPSSESPQLWHDRLMMWKSHPGIQLTLLIEEHQFHVNLSEINVSSWPGKAGEIFNVSLKWHQIDGFIFGGK